MRFFIVGDDYPWSSETGYAREFRRAGCEATIWNNKRPRLLFGRRDWWRMGQAARTAYDALASASFLRAAKAWKPDVIFLPKAENIHSRAVRLAKESTGARVVAWYPDNPFKADMTSMNVLRDLRRTDIFYIWGHFLVEPLQTAGASDVRYLPFAFDPETHPESGAASCERYSCDICFVGAWDAEREKDLEPLASYDLAIWGPGWESGLARSSPLRRSVRGGALYNEEMVACYRSSKVVFNHLRQHNGSAHNMRAMEIAGIGGGVQLVRRTPELSHELFREGEHLLAFRYGSDEELRARVEWALGDRAAATEMAAAARQHVFGNHLLGRRTGQILGDLAKK